MRVYLPATFADLDATDGISARQAHAVTAALRLAIEDDDPESGELAATLIAADESVLRIASEGAPPRRVVVAADVPDAQVRVLETQAPPSAIHVPDVPWSAVVSFHIDDPDDPEVEALVRAAGGGDAAAMDRASELDLLWFDVSERDDLRRRA